MVVELRDKIAPLSSVTLEEEYGVGGAESAETTSLDSMQNDVLSALLNLGYQKTVAERVIGSAVKDGGELSVELILRRSLRLLSPRVSSNTSDETV
jgi:Holliday junction resolvasome RuvABC DNA-binding subunit